MWYAYNKDGWQIAVDAISKKDADALIKHQAYGAEYEGVFYPPTMASGKTSARTAMVTPRRQEEIHADNLRRGFEF